VFTLPAQSYPTVQGGFIHIPFSCEQVLTRANATPSLPIEVMTKGLLAAVVAVGRGLEGDDINPGGATGGVC
jgi:pyrrolidone-carboxylate peptidase